MEILKNYIVYYLTTFNKELIAILILLFFIGIRKIFTKYIFNAILKLTEKTSATFDEKLLRAFKKPISSLFIVLGFYFALTYWPLTATQDIFITKLFRISIIIIITWGLVNLTNSKSTFLEEIKLKLDIDDILIQFFSKFIRFFLIVIAILMVAQEFNYDVNGFIAGLGLGGLAFALAAKDALANIFGGIVIILEKPFLIGDWIKTSSIEGSVEEITFRSTKIRAFDQALITVPNSSLANENIINFSKMGKRRVTFNLQLNCQTPSDKIKKCLNRIENMLKSYPGIHPETIFVIFDKFNESSLDIFLYFFTNTTVWGEYLAVKEKVNFEILRILDEEAVALALPARNVFIEESPSPNYFKGGD